MFDKLIESTTAKKKNRSPYFVATATIWMLVLSTTIAAGIFAFDGQLSDPEKLQALFIVPPPPPPPPTGPHSVSNNTGPVSDNRNMSVREAPDRIAPPEPSQPPVTTPIDTTGLTGTGVPGGSLFGAEDGVRGGVPFGVRGGTPSDAPMPPRQPDPPRPEPEKPVQQKPLVRSTILQGSAIKRVEPSYPVMAKSARVQGPVIVEVTINEKGIVESARAVSGHPLLRDAALNAARSWRWEPTILNQVPVKVIGTITFIFKL